MEVLAHPFFNDLRLQETTLPDSVAMPELFNWNEVELENTSRDLLDRITPSWAK